MPKHCKIIIRDEINIKLEGLDVADRRHFNKQFTYEIPGARFMPAVKLGRWDGKASYFSIAGSTYINLLEEILPALHDRGYEIELEDQRAASTEFQFQTVTETSYSHVLWPEGHDLAGQPILLRDYQTEVINNLLSNPQCIAEVATGAGKTIVTAVLSHCVEQYGRTIVIVPNKSLVVQTERDYRNLGLDVGVYFQERKEIGHRHTICTWQSLNNIYKQTKNEIAEVPIQDFIRDIVCVIVDECFDGNVLVLTPTGYVPIKTLRPGDSVINYSETTGQFKQDIIVNTHQNLTKSSLEKMYELEFDNGSKIKVTGNHKFLTNLGWVRADELTEDHDIISLKT